MSTPKPTEASFQRLTLYASVEELLNNSSLSSKFHGGTFVHYFLSPFDYHRFHAPASGTIQQAEVVQALAYLDVTIQEGQFNAPDDATDGYEVQQTRGILVIETSNDQWIAAIPVGMAQVSSANLTVSSGHSINAGDEFGYFLFGGSDIIMLFSQSSSDLDILEVNTGPNNSDNPQHFLYGQAAVLKADS